MLLPNLTTNIEYELYTQVTHFNSGVSIYWDLYQKYHCIAKTNVQCRIRALQPGDRLYTLILGLLSSLYCNFNIVFARPYYQMKLAKSINLMLHFLSNHCYTTGSYFKPLQRRSCLSRQGLRDPHSDSEQVSWDNYVNQDYLIVWPI